jgi:hypothetical protein
MYYFRTRIPFDLRLWFNGQEDFKRSLKTKSLTQARRLLKVWNYRTEETFTLMRSGMLTQEQIKKLVDNFKHKTLAELEDNRIEAPVISLDNLDEQMDILQEHVSDYREALATNDYKRVSSLTDTLIEDNGLGEVGKREYAELSRELMKKMLEVFEVEKQRLTGNFRNGYDDILPVEPLAAPSVLTPIVSSPMLSLMLDKFMEDQGRKEQNRA